MDRSRAIGGVVAAVGVVVAVLWCQLFLRRSAICQFTPESNSLRGRTVVITGGSAGLGLESAKRLAIGGARIVLTARSDAKGQAAVQQVRDYYYQQLKQQQQKAKTSTLTEDSSSSSDSSSSATPIHDQKAPSIEYKVLELDDLQGVQNAVDRWDDVERIDVLINNAGIMALPQRELTVDGIERQIQSNHLGHFVLTAKLAPKLGHNAVIVILSSDAYLNNDKSGLKFDYLWKAEKSYSPWDSYSASKLANILFAQELQRRADAAALNWTASSLHPGTVDTPLWRHVKASEMFATALSVEQGASTQIWLAAGGGSGVGASHNQTSTNTRSQYYVNCEPVELLEFAKDEVAAQRLWRESEVISGVRFDLQSKLSK